MELGTVTIYNPRGPRKDDDPAKVVGTVGLVWMPAPWIRLHVENSWKDDKGEYQRRETCELARVGEVRADFADVRISEKGQTYLSIRNLQIPWDIACLLGNQARRHIEATTRARAQIGEPEKPLSADDYENARMVTGTPQPGSFAARQTTSDRD